MGRAPWLGLNDLDVLGKGFEPVAVGLDDGDGDSSGLAGLQVTRQARLAFVGSSHHFVSRRL